MPKGGHSSLWRSKLLVLVAAFVISCLCGLGFLHSFNLLFVLLGAPGGLVYIAITQTGAEDGAAKVCLEGLYLVVNTVFYYIVLRFAQRFTERRFVQ